MKWDYGLYCIKFSLVGSAQIHWHSLRHAVRLNLNQIAAEYYIAFHNIKIHCVVLHHKTVSIYYSNLPKTTKSAKWVTVIVQTNSVHVYVPASESRVLLICRSYCPSAVLFMRHLSNSSETFPSLKMKISGAVKDVDLNFHPIDAFDSVRH